LDVPVTLTREPGGTPLAEAVRALLLDGPTATGSVPDSTGSVPDSTGSVPDSTGSVPDSSGSVHDSSSLTARTEALLFAAARSDHVSRLIRPALVRDEVVITDRFVGSSLAYQGAGRGLGEGRIAALNSWATEGLQPDLTVVLDVDPRLGLARAQDRNRLEAEGQALQARVRRSLLDQAAADPERHLVLDADDGRDVIADRIWTVVRNMLLERASEDPGLAPVGPIREVAGSRVSPSGSRPSSAGAAGPPR
jgi:dTMP kinase